ncbi:MAG: hypothetical protein JNM56_02650 [Planctomycetia bacterium]|nr:hypothetical protein [Planctomycetia bacterium]
MVKKRKKPSVSSYFREILNDRPDLLQATSNEEIYQLYTERTKKKVNDRDKAILSNLKSVERKKAKLGGRRTAKSANHTVKAAVGRGSSTLDRLEVSIDDCMAAAKGLDRDGLLSVIDHLRKARNEVVILRGH